MVVVQLAERSHPIPEDLGSNPGIGNFYWTYLLLPVCRKDENKKEAGNGPFFQTKFNYRRITVVPWNQASGFVCMGELSEIGYALIQIVEYNYLLIIVCERAAAIAQWIRLCLPSCKPGFNSQAQHLRLIIQFVIELWVKRAAAISQWIRLCLPSCRPLFDSPAQQLMFII